MGLEKARVSLGLRGRAQAVMTRTEAMAVRDGRKWTGGSAETGADWLWMGGDGKESRVLSSANWVNGCEFHHSKKNHWKRNQCGEKMMRSLRDILNLRS